MKLMYLHLLIRLFVSVWPLQIAQLYWPGIQQLWLTQIKMHTPSEAEVSLQGIHHIFTHVCVE